MLIDPTTEAKMASVKLAAGRSISVRGDLGAELIHIEIPNGAGGWEPLMEGGNAVQLTATQMSLAAMGTILIRVNKVGTTNAVGVEVG